MVGLLLAIKTLAKDIYNLNHLRMLDRSLKYCVAILFTTYLFFMFYQPLEFEDGWWHLATGRWIVEHHQVPHSDPFSFSNEHSEWVFTKWLGSTLFYWSYQFGGYQGVKVFRAVLFLGIIGLFILYSRRWLPGPLLLILCLILVYALQTRCFFRPDIFNYFFVQIFLIQILGFHRDQDKKRLLSLPVFGCLWGNIHLGSFEFGIPLILAGVFNCAVQYLYSFGKNLGERKDKFNRELDLFLIVLVLCFLTLAISPYGLEAFAYPFKLLGQPNFFNFFKTTGLIAEQLPPTYIFSLSGLWFWLLFVGSILAIVFIKRGRFLAVLFLIFPLLMFLNGRRASAFFAVAASYIIVECARQCLWAKWWGSFKYSKVIDRLFYLVVILFLSFQVVVWGQSNIYDHGKYKKNWSLMCDPHNPERAVNFLLDHRLVGNVFTNYKLGGYLIWKAYPQLKPFVDGRQLDQELFKRFAEVVLLGPQRYWDQIERDHQINIVLLDVAMSHNYKLASYLLSNNRWQLVFIDGRIIVCVRKGAFQLSDNIKDIGAQLSTASLNPSEIDLLNVLSQKDFAKMTQKISGKWPPYYIQDLEEGIVLFNLGFKQEGVQRIIRSYTQDPQRVHFVVSQILGGLDS